MLQVVALLIALTLGVYTAASPTPLRQSNAPALGRNVERTSIQLQNRPSFTRADGSFDEDLALAGTVHTMNKHRSNLINHQRNVGSSALRQGAEIKSRATLDTDVQARLERRAALGKRQVEALVDEKNGVEWAGMVKIGTPAQSFLIDFDTGSSDIWIPSSSCTASACGSKSKFNASASTTSVQQAGIFSLDYDDGTSVGGAIYKDTVSIAGIVATEQTFSAVTSLSSKFASDPIDGMVGLAFPALSHLNSTPFFNTASALGAVASNQFSFYLSKNGSELYLGGTDASKFSGDIEFHDVDASTGFWQLPGASVKVGSGASAVVSGFETIIDSGTTLMYGPPDAVRTVYANVFGADVDDAKNGYYSFPCDSIPQIAFNWGGVDWDISSSSFNLGTTANDTNRCMGALVGLDLGLGDGVWLLGDSFMTEVYSVFDYDQQAVGFAALALSD